MKEAACWQSVLGFGSFVAIAWLLSENRRRVNLKRVVVGSLIQFAVAVVLVKIPILREAFVLLNRMVIALQEATAAGTSFVFGYLGGGPLPFIEKYPGSSFILAFHALPMVLLMSALSSPLFYWKALAVAATMGGMMTLISSQPNMILVNILNARALPTLGFFSVTPFGISVLATGIVYMILVRGILSKKTTVEIAKKQAPRAYDLFDSYGLTSWWHRLRVPAGSPMVGRSVAELRSLYDRFGVIPIGIEKNTKGDTKFLPAMPETIFEADDAIFVIVGEDQAQQLIETQQLIKLPRLEERQAYEALQELGVGAASRCSSG